ncbi:MAG: lipopolysaccharide biosynthesis protein [Chloroflexales bacterium]|nr:lipopolysaccharide biosynthesis protein [Chloroflexales bacterium]
MRHWVAMVLGRSAPGTHGQRRYVRIIQATLVAGLGKGLGLFVGIISVPLTIGYLGTERYGLWVTISTLLIWFQLTDIGLGNGLTNLLAEAYGADRPAQAQRDTATAFWMLCGVAALVAAGALLVGARVDWAGLFQVRSAEARAELGPALAVALGLTCLGLPLQVVERVYSAYQEGAVANLWSALGNLASLAALVLVTGTAGGLVALVAAMSGATLAVKVISALWLFTRHKPWLAPLPARFDPGRLRRLSVIGSEFFVLQLAAMVLFQTDSLLIAYVLGPQQVTEYNLVYRLFSFVLLAQGLLLAPLWPAYGEAAARGDWPWIRRAFARSMAVNWALFGGAAIVLALVGQPVITAWTGGLVMVDQGLITLMMVWTLVNIWGGLLGTLLNGLQIVRPQAILALVMAALNIALSLLWVRELGVYGVVLATIVAYGATNAWIAPILGYLGLRRLET